MFITRRTYAGLDTANCNDAADSKASSTETNNAKVTQPRIWDTGDAMQQSQLSSSSTLSNTKKGEKKLPL